MDSKAIIIDAEANGKILHYRELNQMIRNAVRDGCDHITLNNISGQRFIGAGIKGNITLEIFGDTGLDTGVFSDGPKIIIHGASEYLLGNTLNSGELIVYGDSWDVTGMGARGGAIYVMGNGGSRIGIHMKQFKDQGATIVYGGKVKQYCGEYMAGGAIVVLGLDYSDAIICPNKPVTKENIDPNKIKEAQGDIIQSYIGGGIHGGNIYVRGEVPDSLLGVYAVKHEFMDADKQAIALLVKRYSELFNTPEELIWNRKFSKIGPISSRPFGNVYNTTPI